ncbi:MAG TPA: hypothetical protein VGG74_38180 [Kofleriaceae bacterium]
MARAEALMYAGHFAAGLAIRAREPRVPIATALLATGWLDIVHGVLVLVGVEHARPDPSKFLGWDLDYMPWSHSLAAAVAWSLAGAALFARRGRAVAIAIAIGVFSHFALDWPMHEHDLALAPGSQPHLGLALWGWSSIGAWLVEGALVAACAAYYLKRGGRPSVVAVVGILWLSFYPALSPVRMAGVYLA